MVGYMGNPVLRQTFLGSLDVPSSGIWLVCDNCLFVEKKRKVIRTLDVWSRMGSRSPIVFVVRFQFLLVGCCCFVLGYECFMGTVFL